MNNLFNSFIEKIYLSQHGNKVYYDTLTGCRSRIYYDEVAKIKYHNIPICVTFIDIDNLKTINDTLGHSEGSRIIKSIAKQILSLKDNIEDVCRIGGDEFVIFSNLPIDLSAIREISYGCYKKEINEDISSAVSKADNNMHKMKKEKCPKLSEQIDKEIEAYNKGFNDGFLAFKNSMNNNGKE